MSAFEAALQAGMAAARAVAGVAITYTRGATTITISNAIQTATEFEAIEWLVAVDLLTIGVPEPGDTITRTINGTATTYTVEQPEEEKGVFEYSDTSHTQYRIRTREEGAVQYAVDIGDEHHGFSV